MEEETFSFIWSDYDFQSYTNKEAALKELSFYQLMFGKAIPEQETMDYGFSLINFTGLPAQVSLHPFASGLR